MAWRSAFVLLLLMTLPRWASTQQPKWDIAGLTEVTWKIDSLPLKDQLGIEHRLGEQRDNLRATRIEYESDHLFIVSGIGAMCGAANCISWVLDRDYKILLRKVFQTYKVQKTLHKGLPDIVTSMHGSAFDSDLIRWQFDGKVYVKAQCAAAEFGNALGEGAPVIYKVPKITPTPCNAR